MNSMAEVLTVMAEEMWQSGSPLLSTGDRQVYRSVEQRLWRWGYARY